MKSRLTKHLAVTVALSIQVIIFGGCTHLTSCAHPIETSNHLEDLAPDDPASLATGSSEQIREAAIADARADIAASRPRIAFTGGIGSWPVGVSEKYFKVVEPYPRVPLPTGCTSSWLREAAIYAEAYNKEILHYLISNNQQHL